MSTALKIAIVAEASFAVLLGSGALPDGFGGETAPLDIRVGFASYAACAVLIAAGLLWRSRPAAIAGVIFALIYSVPAAWALTATGLWAAPSDPLARSMLLRFGLPLAAQLVILCALVWSRVWARAPVQSAHRATPAA
jgi:hypothetical protein